MPTRPRGGPAPAPPPEDGGPSRDEVVSWDEVMDAALFVTERDGIDGLTVRAVAEALGVAGPTVRHHVEGDDELADRVCEHLGDSVDLDLDLSAGLAWDDRIVAIVLGMDRTLARYPGVAARVFAVSRTARVLRPVHEHITTVVLGAGFPPQEAAALVATVHFHHSGWVLGRPVVLEVTTADPGSRTAADSLAQGGHPALSAVRSNGLVAAATSSTGSSTTDLLETGLRRILDGFAVASASRIPDRSRHRSPTGSTASGPHRVMRARRLESAALATGDGASSGDRRAFPPDIGPPVH